MADYSDYPFYLFLPVTNRHFAAGIPQDCGKCAFALAFTALYPERDWTILPVSEPGSCRQIYIAEADCGIRYILSKKAGAAIQAFDSEGKFSPAEYVCTLDAEIEFKWED